MKQGRRTHYLLYNQDEQPLKVSSTLMFLKPYFRFQNQYTGEEIREFFEIMHGRGSSITPGYLNSFQVSRIATAIYTAFQRGIFPEIMKKYLPEGWDKQIYRGRLLEAIK